MIRKGLGKGQGKGYKNIIPHHDKKVHSDSSKGIKQPQIKNVNAKAVKLKKQYAFPETTRLKEKMMRRFKDAIDLSLPVEQAIFVPTTTEMDKEISKKEIQKRIEDTEKFLSTLFGGFTEIKSVGGYKEGNRIIKENSYVVYSYTTIKDFNDAKKQNQLLQWIKKKRKEWKQDSIGYEFEGDMFYLK